MNSKQDFEATSQYTTHKSLDKLLSQLAQLPSILQQRQQQLQYK